MQVTYASEAAPGGTNEDYVVSGPDWVAILDGATPRIDTNSGCVHDVSWLVRNLGIAFATYISADSANTLADSLRNSIQHVRDMHSDTCDLNNPDSPSATFAAIKVRVQAPEPTLDYLVLGDSPIAIEHTDGTITAISDQRSGLLSSYTTEAVRAARNQPNGFWIASTVARAADEALAGGMPIAGMRRTTLMTDGVTRYFERLGMGGISNLLQDLNATGPWAVIKRIRKAEEELLPGESTEPNGRRVKRHDDATAVVVDWKGDAHADESADHTTA